LKPREGGAKKLYFLRPKTSFFSDEKFLLSKTILRQNIIVGGKTFWVLDEKGELLENKNVFFFIMRS
jgi:hypothetical protein